MISLFTNVTQVTNIMTSNPQFFWTVELLGGRVVEFIDPEERRTRLEIQGFMLDIHPDISTTIKGLTKRWSGDLVEQKYKDYSWRYMTEIFNASFL